MTSSDTAPDIIDLEFGGNNAGKTEARECFWWKDMLIRVKSLCEKAEQIGYKHCQEIHKDKIMVPEIKEKGCSHIEICKYYGEDI